VYAPGTVVAEHEPKQFRVTIEEILVGLSVVEELLFDGAEQSVGELLDGLLPRLKASAADVEVKSMVSETTWSTVVYSWRHGTARDRHPADR